MRICLICVEIFAWGKYGGFGRATRTIGRELARRGIEVFAVVPRRRNQKPVEQLDGMTVLSFPVYRPWSSKGLYRECNADLYHSCEPSYGTFLAMKEMPHKKHIVTVRDPRDSRDWKMEFALPSLGKLRVLSNYLYEDSFLVRRAVGQADAVYCSGKFFIPKVKAKYKLRIDPKFLPTPVTVPVAIKKSKKPTVCYIARWDRRKRPELFLRLAKDFPGVQFIAVGSSQDKIRDGNLRNSFSNLPNLEMTGFVDQFKSDLHSKTLEKSWIMVNTATREGLPNSFLEAAAHGCAILSAVDPDGFSSQFGCLVKNDRFDEGLRILLNDRNWEVQGQRGREYVRENFEMKPVIDQHMTIYQHILTSQE